MCTTAAWNAVRQEHCNYCNAVLGRGVGRTASSGLGTVLFGFAFPVRITELHEEWEGLEETRKRHYEALAEADKQETSFRKVLDKFCPKVPQATI